MRKRNMVVTAEIKKLFNDGGKVKANLSLTIEGVFVVRSVRLIEGSKGFFISMPSRKKNDGEYIDICFPINNDTRLRILDIVMAAYEKALSEQGADENADDDGEADSGDE